MLVFSAILLSLSGAAAKSIVDENGVSFHAIEDSAQRTEVVTAYFNEFYRDNWAFVPIDDCITPVDGFSLLAVCDNRRGTIEMKCTYERRHGVTMTNEDTYQETTAIDLNADVQIKELQKMFSAKLGFSYKTDYLWSQASSQVWNAAKKYTFVMTVKPGELTAIYQVVGNCGAYSVFVPEVKTEHIAPDEAGSLSVVGFPDGQLRKILFTVPGKFNFTTASRACLQTDGANLASIRSEKEFKVGKRLVGSILSGTRDAASKNTMSLILGAVRETQGGDFNWVGNYWPEYKLASSASGAPPINPPGAKTFWSSGQPGRGPEMYVGTKADFKWHAIPQPGENGYPTLSAFCEFVF